MKRAKVWWPITWQSSSGRTTRRMRTNHSHTRCTATTHPMTTFQFLRLERRRRKGSSGFWSEKAMKTRTKYQLGTEAYEDSSTTCQIQPATPTAKATRAPRTYRHHRSRTIPPHSSTRSSTSLVATMGRRTTATWESLIPRGTVGSGRWNLAASRLKEEMDTRPL